jgi:tRNA-dihydrouridine synthase
VEHLGGPRAGRYLRQFYPWYLERLGADKTVRQALQQTSSVDEARALLNAFADLPRAA